MSLYVLMKQLEVAMGTSPDGRAYVALLQLLKLLHPDGEQVPHLLLCGLQVSVSNLHEEFQCICTSFHLNTNTCTHIHNTDFCD